MNNLDILSLEWPNSDRDLHIVTPVLVYLNKRYNITYKMASIFKGYYYILKYKPKLLLISNFQGATINNEIVKFAYSSGIKVVSLISEGNVKAESFEQFLWGHNNDRQLYVDKILLWSKRSEKIFLDKYPVLKDKFITTGATGFDRYKLLKFKSKDEFLQENNLKFKKIVGIAAWGFDHFFGSYYENYKEYYLSVFGQEQINMHRDDLFKLQDIYKRIIEHNQEILFILRFHPGTIDLEKNEFYGLEKYHNVFISSKFENSQYNISDLINISDLWIGYETTTALESWLLGKQTFLINPTRTDFIRENVYRGSPIATTYQEAQNLIDEVFKYTSIKDFVVLDDIREGIIHDVIEYGDGQNHIRAAEEIKKVLSQKDKKIDFGFRGYKEAFKQIVKLLLAKTILKNKWPHLRYKSDFSKSYEDMYRKLIDA